MSAPDVARLVAALQEKLQGRWRFVGGPFHAATLEVLAGETDDPASEQLLAVESLTLGDAPVIRARAVPYRRVRELRLAGARPRLLSTLVIPSCGDGLVFDRRSDRPGVVTHYRGAFHALGGGVNPPTGAPADVSWLRREALRETEEETHTTLPLSAVSDDFWLTEEPTTGYLQACFAARMPSPPIPSAEPDREGDPFVQPQADMVRWLLASWRRWVPSGLAAVLLDLVLRRGLPEEQALTVVAALDPGELAEP